MKKQPTLVCLDAGNAAYEPTLDLQMRLVEDLKSSDDAADHLILVEHNPPVITLGRSGKPENIVAPASVLAKEGIETHKTGRGGDVTYHGPGQLVGYPIVRLAPRGYDVGRYVRNLEEVLIRSLAHFGIQAGRSKGMTGVWVGDGKVAAIGVAVSRWVTYHGFALNVSPNLNHFNLIVPCGIQGKLVTSISKLLDREVAADEVKPVLLGCVVEVFGYSAVEMRGSPLSGFVK